MGNEPDIIEKTLEAVRERFPGDVVDVEKHARHLCVVVNPAAAITLLGFLKSYPAAPFDMLTDLLGVDYCNAGKPERFAVIYQLYSFAANARMAVKAYLPETKPEIATATGLWAAANWAEREAYDLYGILFQGHPNLKRLLLPEGYTGHPLRKDYPLKGRGERDRFPVMR